MDIGIYNINGSECQFCALDECDYTFIDEIKQELKIMRFFK